MHMHGDTLCLHVSFNVSRVLVIIIGSLLVYIVVCTSMSVSDERLQEAITLDDRLHLRAALLAMSFGAERGTKAAVWPVCPVSPHLEFIYPSLLIRPLTFACARWPL